MNFLGKEDAEDIEDKNSDSG